MQGGLPRRAPQTSNQAQTGRKINNQRNSNQSADYRWKYNQDPQDPQDPLDRIEFPVIIKKKTKLEKSVGSSQYRLSGNLSRIKFCFENPYNLQLRYMEHILKCLDEGKNALIESPTGSGKTLCLLSSVLGWVNQDNHSKVQQKAHFSQFINKIVYLSKTHSQLDQVVEQLSKTCYRPSMVVLGSRQKLCIHPQVIKSSDSTEQNKKCNQAVRKKIFLQDINKLNPQQFSQQNLSQEQYQKLINDSCAFYKPYKVRKNRYKKVFQGLEDDVVSISDERFYNKQSEICPYFYPTTTKFFANMVLMPFNYLTSGKIFRRYEQIVQKSIIIFDQGHNIIQSMCQGSSMQFRHNMFQNLGKELQKIMKQMLKKRKDIPKQKLSFDAEDLQSRKAEQQRIKKQQKQIKSQEQIKQIINNLIEEFKKIHINFSTYCLNKARIMKEKKDKKQRFQDDDNEIKQCISNNQVKKEFLSVFFGGDSNDIQKCIQQLYTYSQRLQDIYEYLFVKSGKKFAPFLLTSYSETFAETIDILQNQQRLQHYALFMNYSKLWKIQQDQWLVKIVLYCFSPKYMFKKIMEASPKSIIITSGTLSPLHSWKTSTGLGQSLLDFSNNNDHVINQDQTKTILVSSIEKSPLHIVTTTNVDQSVKNAYKTIKIICQNTPHGVLVVLGSKSWSKKFQKYHRQIDVSSMIEKKQIFFQTNQNPRQINTFLEKYQKAANSPKGALLFLVCRGKLSEGIDFKDNMARAVVMIGIPLKNFRDPFVVEHKQYCKRQKRKNPLHQSGDDWEKQEVIRAINQSIGRVIRNSKDFGMIFLVDDRYSEQWDYEHCFHKNLSGWALKNVSEQFIDATQIPDMCKEFFNIQRNNGRM